MSAPYESDTLFQSNFCRWPKLISSLSFISLQILKLAASMALHESQAIEQNPLSGAHVSYILFFLFLRYCHLFLKIYAFPVYFPGISNKMIHQVLSNPRRNSAGKRIKRKVGICLRHETGARS